MKQHAGHLSVESAPGNGTTFRIYFPRVTEEACVTADARVTPETGVTAKDETPKVIPISSGRMPPVLATILVVDDDRGVRSLIRDILTFAGYHVIATENGDQALSASDHHAGEIQLLVADIQLPNISGEGVARRLAQKRRGIKMLFTSGYGRNMPA